MDKNVILKQNKVYLGDCLEIMKQIDDKSIDMILCDLPYGTTARNKWDIIIPFELLWKHYERIIKDNGVICLTAAEPFSAMMIVSNLKLFRYDLIWEKDNPVGFLNANRMPLRKHEKILMFYKKLPTYNPQMSFGHKKMNITYRDNVNMGSCYNSSKMENEKNHVYRQRTGETSRYPTSVIKCNSVRGNSKERSHPTQKPVALFEYLIKTYTNEGDLVLDNCAGSGTTGVACQNLNRNFILIEKEQKYYDIIIKRLEENKKSV